MTVLQYRIEPPAPFVTHSGHALGLDVTLVTLGKCKSTEVDNVGTVPAALATYLTLQAIQPDLLINAGTAGGFISQVHALLQLPCDGRRLSEGS